MSNIRHQPIAPTETWLLPAGSEVDRHCHDNHQLIYASAGMLEVFVAEGTWFAPSTRAIWVPGGAPHHWAVHGSSVVHMVGLPANAATLSDQPVLIVVEPLLRELVVTAADTEIGTPAHRRLLAVLLDQLTITPEQPTMLPRLRDERLRGMAALVAQDLSCALSLDELAYRVGSSARTLSRHLRQETGLTFPQWRTQLRLRQASLLLAEGSSVTHVARACGWASPSAFIATYRKYFGHTPGTRSTYPTTDRQMAPDYTGLVWGNAKRPR
jgi:AraC-like DNA-binding protein